MVCSAIIATRARKGQMCGRRCTGERCGMHSGGVGRIPVVKTIGKATKPKRKPKPKTTFKQSPVGDEINRITTKELQMYIKLNINIQKTSKKKHVQGMTRVHKELATHIYSFRSYIAQITHSFKTEMSDYTIRCADIAHNFDSYTVKYHALREVHQKQILNCNLVKNLKNKCRVNKSQSDTRYRCHQCGHIVKQLHAAHVGITASEIIKDVLTRHPRGDIPVLLQMVVDKHKPYELTVCCPKCNKMFEYIDCGT